MNQWNLLDDRIFEIQSVVLDQTDMGQADAAMIERMH